VATHKGHLNSSLLQFQLLNTRDFGEGGSKGGEESESHKYEGNEEDSKDFRLPYGKPPLYLKKLELGQR